MERLTDRYKDSIANKVLIRECGDKLCKNICDDIEYDCSKCELEKALEKLADYEDAEEQGLLVRLPVNKNKEIYIISSRWTVCSECGSRFDEYSCSGCEYECDSKKEYYVYPTYLSFIDVTTYVNQFKKTIFLTYEEAAKKLEEMKNNGSKK